MKHYKAIIAITAIVAIIGIGVAYKVNAAGQAGYLNCAIGNTVTIRMNHKTYNRYYPDSGSWVVSGKNGDGDQVQATYRPVDGETCTVVSYK